MALCKMFEEDEVSVLKNSGQFRCGIVLECSENVSSDEEDAGDDATSQDKIKKGTVRVAWHPEGTEEVVEEKKLHLADRSIMPGEIVRRLVEGQDSQRGCVTRSQVRCHLQVLTKPIVICDVDTRELLPFSRFEVDPGDVYMDSWVGKIEAILENYTLRLQDGARCEALEDDLSMFEDVLDKRDGCEFSSGAFYYIGQQLRGDLGALENAKWLKSTVQHSARAARKHRSREVMVTIENIVVECVDVRWLCRGCTSSTECSTESLLNQPDMSIKGANLARLKQLDCFEACGYQLGDKAFYVLRDSDQVVALGANKRCDKPAVLHTFLRQHSLLPINGATAAAAAAAADVSRNNAQNKDAAVESGGGGMQQTATRGDDASLETTKLLENGAETHSSSDEDDSDFHDGDDTRKMTTSLGEVHHDEEGGSNVNGGPMVSRESLLHTATRRRRGTAELWTGAASCKIAAKSLKKKKVPTAKPKHKPAPAVALPKPGDRLPVEIVYTQTFVDVIWQDGTVEKNIPSVDLFPMHHLDELEFFPCDFVVSTTDPRHDVSSGVCGIVQSVQHTGRTCTVKWIKPGSSSEHNEVLEIEEVSVYDIKEHPDMKYQLGNVVVRVLDCPEDPNSTDIIDASKLSSASATPVGGQIYALCPDGRLEVQWADGSHSLCHPCQLFVVSDELTDDDVSENDDDDDDNSDKSSSCDWLTEEEEQVASDVDSGTAIDVENEISLSTNATSSTVTIHVANAARTFQSVLSAIDSMDQLIAVIRSGVPNSALSASRAVLGIYRCCRMNDRMLGTEFFADDDLVALMASIRRQVAMSRVASRQHKIGAKLARTADGSWNPSNVAAVAAKDDLQNNDGDEDDDDEDDSKPAVQSLNASMQQGDDDTTSSSVRPPLSALAPSLAEKGSTDPLPASSDGSWSKTDFELVANEMCLLIGELKRGLSRLCPLPSDQSGPGLSGSNSGISGGPLQPSVSSSTDSTGNEAAATLMPAEQVAGRSADLVVRACRHLRRLITSTTAQSRLTVEVRTSSVAAADASFSSGGEVGEEEAGKGGSQGGTTIVLMSQTDDAVLMADEKKPLGAAEQRCVEPLDVGSDSAMAIREFVVASTNSTSAAAICSKAEFNPQGFTLIESVPSCHHFKNMEHNPVDAKAFTTAVYKEFNLLQTCLPQGIYVKGFEDRMDLFSVMIQGPAKTPYEDGLFFFDVQLPSDYPKSPPVFFYVSYCRDRLNPNLYEDGKVCVSLLGTWSGKGTEVWNSSSNLLQVVLSIQALILCQEPYYNEAGYEKQKGTQLGLENSRLYNEMAILKLVQSMTKMVTNPVMVFKPETKLHMKVYARRMIRRLEYWLEVMPPVKGSDISLTQTLNPADACTRNASTTSTQLAHVPSLPTATLAASSSTALGPDSVVDHNSTSPPAMDIADAATESQPPPLLPEFPLLPVSLGLKMALHKVLSQFEATLSSAGISRPGISVTPAGASH